MCDIHRVSLQYSYSFILFYCSSMERDEIISLCDSCRLCLRRPGVFNVFKIKGLLLDIYEFTGVKVFMSDILPPMICSECSSIIENIKQLKKSATSNDIHMRSLISEDNDTMIRFDFEQADDKQGTEAQLSSPNRNTDNNQSKLGYDDGYIKKVYVSEEPISSVAEDSVPTKPHIAVRGDLFSSVSEPLASTDATTSVKKENTSCKDMFQFETLFRCEICSKDFATWKKFYLHKRQHNKSVVCPTDGCDKKFASKGDLQKHIRTHTGEKPYKCEFCCKRFAQKGTLNSHKENIHDIIDEVIIDT